jgi:hypothetical protein
MWWHEVGRVLVQLLELGTVTSQLGDCHPVGGVSAGAEITHAVEIKLTLGGEWCGALAARLTPHLGVYGGATEFAGDFITANGAYIQVFSVYEVF